VGPHDAATEGEAQDPHGAALTDDPVGAGAVDPGVEIGIVGVGLQHEHRIEEGRPVGVLRVGLEVKKIPERDVHDELAVEQRSQPLALRIEGLADQLAGRSQQLEVFGPARQLRFRHG